MVENGESNENERQGDELMEHKVNVEKGSKGKSKEEQPTPSTTVPIPPAVPFSQRLNPNKLDKDFVKFVKIFKQSHINIPFADAILHIPSYATFLKEIMTRKRKLEDRKMIALTKECSAITQNKLHQS